MSEKVVLIDRDELLKHEVMIITKGNAAFHGVPSSLIEKCWCWLTVGKATASQRPFMRTELFLSTKASGSGKMSMVTAFMTKKRTCIDSGKAGGNIATLPRRMHWNAR